MKRRREERRLSENGICVLIPYKVASTVASLVPSPSLHMKGTFCIINNYLHLLAPTPTFLHIGKVYVETFYSFICSSVCTKSTSLPPTVLLQEIILLIHEDTNS